MAAALPRAVLLVDGYNIIGAWSALQQLRDRGGLEAARQKLTDLLTDYSAVRGYSTRLVFDAQYRQGTGAEEAITDHLTIYYTEFGQTADTYIEKACALARHSLPQRLIVATSDRAQQLMILGYGAEWLSAQQLAYDVKAAAKLVRQQLQSMKRSPGRLLAHSLDPTAQKRLEQLRRASADGTLPRHYQDH
jgi:uncharacterized protein